jgi:hypothetical protein
VLSVATFAIYFILTNQGSGVIAKGTESSDQSFVQYVALATSVVSMLTAIFGLAKTVMERGKGS